MKKSFLSIGNGFFGVLLFFCLPILGEGGISHYERLGVPETATADRIMERFIELTVNPPNHPVAVIDGSGPQNRQSAIVSSQEEIRESWAVLSDPERRREYDKSLQAAPHTGQLPQPLRQTTRLHEILTDPRIRSARFESQRSCCPPSHLCSDCRGVENEVLRNLSTALNADRTMDINAITDRNGNTALMLAVQRKIPRAVRFLIQHGARVDIPNDAGLYPLEAASRPADPETRSHWSYGEDAQVSRVISRMIKEQKKEQEREDIASLPREKKRDLLISAIQENDPRRFKYVWAMDAGWTQEDINQLLHSALLRKEKTDWWMEFIQTSWDSFSSDICRQRVGSNYQDPRRIGRQRSSNILQGPDRS